MVAEPGSTRHQLAALSQTRTEFVNTWTTARSQLQPEITNSMDKVGLFIQSSEALFTALTNTITTLESGIIPQLLQNSRNDKPRDREPFYKDISEHRALVPLKTFSSSREQFITWNDKLINAVSRIHRGTREK